MKTILRIAGFGLVAGAAVMIAGSLPATARGKHGGGEAMMSRSDGMMGASRGGLFTVRFSDLDTDGDGRITEAELVARADALVADRLAQVDADGDGAVTADEIEARLLAWFGDRAGPREGVEGGRKGPGAEMRDPAARAAAIAERMIGASDADGDGVLSGAEMSPAGRVAALIDRFDTDDDNAWDAEEFARAVPDRGGEGRRGHGPRGGRH